ncbi:hypothetical protein STCU_10539 [Strigomonas culicis]|uniref:Myosin motor domain-containing protein n=1 Tax=Strigomonas culicis TaxID=28005 RepID=S9V3W2_9TRYP|nr:hypothetical protein STCU_10539 [Strigomonas culicis]|eukprot:EPY17540.1 hypothetical protein STCU_10539 [Strigomonas culicis]
MEVPPEALERALTRKILRTIERGTETVIPVPLDAQQCRSARDALAKNLYHYVFYFIVGAVNSALDRHQQQTQPHAPGAAAQAMHPPRTLMLGVLDIYGFEVFESNRFEQFCINYVNEKLQQIFIDLTLKKEQAEYKKENIQWETIPFFDNKSVVDLIEGERGMFSYLDDLCATMAKEEEDVVDQKILEKFDVMYSSYTDTHNYKHQNEKIFFKNDKGFVIKHYAGDVQYTTEGFTSANKDLLSHDLLQMLAQCENAFLLEMLEPLLAAASPTATGGGPPTRVTTAGYKIKHQTGDLIRTLRRCQPHYIRTIKPNDLKSRSCFWRSACCTR